MNFDFLFWFWLYIFRWTHVFDRFYMFSGQRGYLQTTSSKFAEKLKHICEFKVKRSKNFKIHFLKYSITEMDVIGLKMFGRGHSNTSIKNLDGHFKISKVMGICL